MMTRWWWQGDNDKVMKQLCRLFGGCVQINKSSGGSWCEAGEQVIWNEQTSRIKKKDKLQWIIATIFIRITAVSMIVLSEFKQPGRTISYSGCRSFICLGNLFHFKPAGYASELLHFICQCLIFLQNWSGLAACAGRTYIHWLAVRVLQGSILFVGLLSAIILFGSAHLFIGWTSHLCRSFKGKF